MYGMVFGPRDVKKRPLVWTNWNWIVAPMLALVIDLSFSPEWKRQLLAPSFPAARILTSKSEPFYASRMRKQKGIP